MAARLWSGAMQEGAIDAAGLPPLIAGLLAPSAYPHPVGEPIRCLQTHISWVLLTGSFAYKIRKPVNLGFLDFTSLEQRRLDCLEELRLNRRLCADLYDELVSITGTEQQPRIAAASACVPVLEYAVRMRQFPQRDLLPAALARGAVGPHRIEAFAERLARFHGSAAIAPAAGSFGTPRAVREPVLANFASLESRLEPVLQPQLQQLRSWEEHAFTALAPQFAARLAGGRVRECHGDLHLGNLVLHRGRIEAFDCLEFNPALRWIDVISDLAFLVMDLQQRGYPDLATLLLNRWLELSGDYAGLRLWRWYSVYRALVRAKVAALGDQPDAVRAYVVRALAITSAPPRLLLLCHGLSGSGKSHHSGGLLAPLAAIRLRSDVERKRLFGLWGDATEPPRRGDLYAPAVTEELFAERLPAAAAAVLAAGFNAIVDATFLRQQDRERMAAVAAAAGVPLLILDFQVPLAVLRQRIRQRQRQGEDPSDAYLAVLERQRCSLEPLTAQERPRALVVGAAAAPAATARAVRDWLAGRASRDSEPIPDRPHPPGCAAPPAGSGSADGC
jgi:aminoglycoside phosphotransferase family enzyme